MMSWRSRRGSRHRIVLAIPPAGKGLAVACNQQMRYLTRLNRIPNRIMVGAVISLSLAAPSCSRAPVNDAAVKRTADKVAAVSAKVQSLESKDGDISKQLSDLQTSLAAIQTSVTDLQKASEGSTLQKKIDDLSAKITSLSTKLDSLTTKVNSIDSRLTLLQQRYDDHLRKYHNGG